MATETHAFEQTIDFVRFGSDNYRFDIRSSEISLFLYSIFAHLAWGGGVTVTDLLLDEVIKLKTTIKIAPWYIRKLRTILNAQSGYSVPAGTHAYAVVVSDKLLTFQSDGSKMSVVY